MQSWEPALHNGVQDSGGGQTAAADDGEVLDLSKYLGAVRKRWTWLLACLLISVTFALVQYSLTTKEYRSSATIQIERKRLSLLALGQGGWLEDWWNMEYYPTQYRLLRSRGMAERVVRNLRLYENPAFTGRPASLLPGRETQGSTVQVSDAELAQLAGLVQSGLTVKPIKETQLVELSFVSPNPELAARIVNGYAQAFIEWGVETRSSTVGQASSFLARQIETLNQEIEERQKTLNGIISQGDFALDPDGEALLKRRQALDAQYNTVVVERLGKEAAYREIQSLPPESFVDSNSQGQVAKLKADIFLLESDYESKLATYTPEWPEMRRLKEDLDEKREQLQRLIQDAYKETRDRAYAEYQRAKREEETIEEELQRLAKDARLQNSAALEYTNHVTYIDTRKETLAELVKRQSETEVASRVQSSHESNVRIVDSAIVASGAFRPSLSNSLSRAILIGLFLGFGGIFLREYLDRTISSPEELEAIMGLPTLAVIPDLNDKGRRAGGYRYAKRGYGYGYGYGYGSSEAETPRKKRKLGKAADAEANADGAEGIELLPHRDPRLAICEAYRSLRTALLLSSAEELRVIGVTSAEPGEGKTATVTNLGVVLAQLERRVLVIDADLRRPRMHKVFKVSNRLGLVNYLTSRVDIESMILETGVPNLYICPSGPIPPNPSELLASDRLRELLQLARSRFDFVLLDTPPTLPVADAVILGPHTDGLVVCGKAGVLLREDAKLCRERLRYAGIRVFGTVLNRYRRSPGGSYSRRYRYYGVYEEASSTSRAPSAA
ncbi:MAG: polysaccharide biosynthesis tyrosine autokinase [bacterium]|nr:polysaccharide biosynthesis tyrosine autokinase [bacterium]